MPAGLIRGLAKRYGTSTMRVERYWHECKASVEGDGDSTDGKYARIVGCVKKRLGAKKK